MGVDEVQFTFSSTASGASYVGGSNTITVTNPSSTLASGPYTVSYTLSGANSYPSPGLTATMTYVAGTNSGTFVVPAANLSNAGTTYLIITGITACSAISTGSAFAAQPLVVANTPANQATITFNTPSVAPTGLQATHPVICSGGSSSISTDGTGSLGTGATWSWYSDAAYTHLVNTSSASNAALTVYPTQTTTYYLAATGTASPCTGTVYGPAAGITVQVAAVPTVTIAETDNSGTANDYIVCTGTSTATLTANPAATGATSFTYSWTGGSTAQNPSVTPGIYTVTVTNEGCSNATAIALATISLAASPSVSIGETDISGTANDGIVCTATTTANLSANATPTGSPNVYSYL